VAEDDELKVVRLIAGDEHVDVMLLASNGKCIRFPVEHERPWKDTKLSGAPTFSRTARGNKGIALDGDDCVVDALLVPRLADEVLAGDDEDDSEPDEVFDEEEIEGEEPWESTLLTVTELGYGKRTPFHAYRLQNRAGKGVISHGTTVKTGGVVGALEVHQEDQLMLVTDTGRVIRILAGSVRLVKSRASQGVRLMRLEEGERIVDMARVEDTDEDENLLDSGEE
jgi:DNA gyrase subunit A